MANVTITGYPSAIAVVIPVNPVWESNEIVCNIHVDASDFDTDDEYLTFNYEGVDTIIWLVEECRYSPTQIHFVNKHGGQEVLHFYKTKESQMKVKKLSYERNYLQPSEGSHQFVNFGVQGKSNFKLSSGYVEEQHNDIFKQLLLSSRIWMYDATESANPIPLTNHFK